MLEIVVMIEETSGIWAITCRPMIGAPPGTDRNAAPALGAASLAQAEDQLSAARCGAQRIPLVHPSAECRWAVGRTQLGGETTCLNART